MLRKIKKLTGVAALGLLALTRGNALAEDVTLRGASLFDNDHAYTNTMVKCGELVNEYYDGDVEFDIRLNSELGIEPDYVNFLVQGVAIDFAIIALSNLARFAPSVPLMDMPFVKTCRLPWSRRARKRVTMVVGLNLVRTAKNFSRWLTMVRSKWLNSLIETSFSR